MAITNSDERLLRINQIALRAGVSRQTVYAWIRSGRLRTVRAGARLRIPESAWQEFIRVSTQGGTPPDETA